MQTKTIIYSLIVIVLFTSLFFLIKPEEKLQELPVDLGQTNNVNAEPQEKTFEIVIKDRKVITGPDTIKVREGEQVVLKITSDENEEFHLHGYDKRVDLVKDTQAELSFTANLTGRFPVELEKSKTDVIFLEVLP